MNAEPDRSNAPSSGNDSAKGDDGISQTGTAPEAGEKSAAAQLTKEEQWALFEKELKESDWGHQPC